MNAEYRARAMSIAQGFSAARDEKEVIQTELKDRLHGISTDAHSIGDDIEELDKAITTLLNELELISSALQESEAEVATLRQRNVGLEERIYAQADEIVQLAKDKGKTG